jgi:hypothetical protein
MRGRRTRWIVHAGLALVAAWAVAAYLLIPLVWTEVERDTAHPPRPMLTTTAQGIPGDPVNVGLVGTKEEVVRAFASISWRAADAITFESSLEIGLSVALDRPDADAPVSTLYYDGRRQDLAFEKEDGRSASHRHHVRLWRTDEASEDGRPLWLGSASYDRDAGFSHDTGQFTHHIAPDVDAERDLVMGALEAAGLVAARYAVPGRGATRDGRNGGGDPYFTDGLATVAVLKP